MSATWTELPRLVRTVRHLRPSQVGWRLRYLVQRRLESQTWFRLADRVARRIDGMHRNPSRPYLLGQQIHNNEPATIAASHVPELRDGKLTLLNRTLPFAGGDDWCLQGGRSEHRLWRYHLHYHGWLVELAKEYQATGNAACLEELRHWLIDWMTICQLGAPGFTHYPWNSYTIAQRLWHWREIAACVPASFWNHRDLSWDRFQQSVAAQADYLLHHLEWDLRGNHLFKDAVGLAAAADLWGGSGPSSWVAAAAEIVESQVAEQILPDGVHFERSPMYHIHVLEDLLALLTLLPGDGLQQTLRDACRRMAEPLRWMRHPCGIIPLFNDAAEHQVSQPAEIETELLRRGIVAPEEPPTGLRHFASAGLVAWKDPIWTVFFDVGEVGPVYQPGHAHADSLTVELSIHGQRLVVDPGTFCYDHDDRRRYDRSTAAHNTVCIDGLNSSEVWHIFRVGQRSMPVDVSVMEMHNGFTASASHTGYEALPGSPRHLRRIHREGESRLEIHDHISGEGRHHVEGGFLLAPEWTAETTSDGWLLHCGTRRLEVQLHANHAVATSVAVRPWHPDFGIELMTQRLVWSGHVSLPLRVQTTWQRG